MAGLSLIISYPHPNEELPVGAAFVVTGTAAGTGGAEPQPDRLGDLSG